LIEPFGYKGQFGYYTDNETGLQVLTYRCYEPSAGRFLTRDPISYSGGINLYAYVRNGPTNAIDPRGLDIMVIEQGPTAGNPIGHTAIAITGRGVFSFGNGRELATDAKGNIMGGNLPDYIYRESMNRNTWIYIIKTTPAQDAAIEAELRAIAQNEPSLEAETILFDNCSMRSNRGLDKAGIPMGHPKTGRTLGPGVPGSAGQRAMIAGASGELIPQGAGWLPQSLAGFISH
jgi:RHS repeat-associated protein